MDEWSNLEQALDQLAASGAVEVHEDGEWLAGLDGFRTEVRRKGKQALIHLWSSESNLVRTILRVSACEPTRIQLEVQRFGRAKPGRLEFLSSASPRPAVRVGREQFRARFGRMLAEQFPDARVESLTTSADLKRSFSALYTRGMMAEGRSSWAVMGVAPSENAAALEGILGYGLLWLDAARQRPEVGLEVYEFNERDWRVRRVQASSHGNVESWLTPRQEVERTPPATHEVSFRFRGLEFARWDQGRIYFGLGDDRRLLTSGDSAVFQSLLGELSLKRSSDATDTNDPLYRGAPERWLESAVRADPARLDAHLDSRYLYSQVPALAAGERGVIDLLGVTHQGRLVVAELKASEDLQLPLQAVDYWLRVRRHLIEDHFRGYGYFPGVDFRPDPPLVWLVAPGLRFHAANEILVRYLSPDLQISRIGLNENWRRGVRVVFRQ